MNSIGSVILCSERSMGMDKRSSLIEQSRFLEQLGPQATLYTCIYLAIDIWLGVHAVISDFCHCSELRCGLRNIHIYWSISLAYASLICSDWA